MPIAVKRPAATELVPCNLCGTSEYDVVARRDRDGQPLQTVLCRSCGLVWTNPRAPAGEIDVYYESVYRPDYTGAPAPARRKLLRGLLGARERRDALRPLLRARAAVLDVGCGAGELVFLLRQDGIDAVGIEPGAGYAEFARRFLGVPVQTATVDTADIGAASLDAVTMYHCLEHVADPKHVLSRVGAWLRMDGVVVVEVPNLESTVQAPSHRYHYAHLYHFSAPTLAALGEAAGLRVMSTRYSADGGNVTCVFRRAAGLASPMRDLGGHAAAVRELLDGHTAVGHYLSPTPYARAIARLRRRLQEDRLLRRLSTVEEVVRWAGVQVAPP